MPCYRPSPAYRTPHGSDQAWTFNAQKALNPDNPTMLPCNRCNGCRQDQSEMWSARCFHELQMHQANSFITLTYADEHLPQDYSLNKRTFQLFMKRLRKAVWKSNRYNIKFFAGGEYGPLDRRPHYHAIIFGHDFLRDRVFLKYSESGEPLYTSKQLSDAWQNQGFCTVGSANYSSIKYCTGYIFDKQFGEKATNLYTYTHPVTGDVVKQIPEFSPKSSGLGRSWYEKYKGDCFPSDFIVIDGKQLAVPRYYKLKLTEEEIDAYKRRHYSHPLKPRTHREPRKADRTPARLKVREEVHTLRLKRRKHTL